MASSTPILALSDHTMKLKTLTLAVLCLALFGPAFAGGVRTLTLASIPQARTPIAVDGRFTGWPDERPVAFVPIDPGLAKSGSPALDKVRAENNSARLQACYDDRMLYVGITWSGIGKSQRVGDVTLHIKSDRIVHVRIVDGAVSERVGDSFEWTPLAPGLAKSVVVRGADDVVTQEIAIAWSALAQSGASVPQITIAADLAWSNLTPALLAALPNDVLRGNTYQTACFLTSKEKEFGLDACLLDPNDWGTLHFTSRPDEGQTPSSDMMTGTTDITVARCVPGTTLASLKPEGFEQVTYAPAFLGARYSAKIATAYDDHFLYIVAHVKSPGGPRNNQHELTQAGYAGGDCLQIRLNDGKATVNLCAWYDSAAHKPALTADGVDLKNPFLLAQGANEVFEPDADGYTQKIAIPWSVFPKGSAPADGDSWKGTFQVWWSSLSPIFTAFVSPTLDRTGAISYTYTLPSETNVTLGVFDGQGHLIRTLIKDAHRKQGRSTEYWDGKDQYGNAIAAGTYQVRGIEHPPIEVQHTVSICNPGTPPWPTPDGKGDWLSDEAAPQSVVTDGVNVYLAAPGCEKGNTIIAVGPDGKRLWGFSGTDCNPRCVSLAIEGKYVYALYSGPEIAHAGGKGSNADKQGRAFIVCLDKTTGVPAQFSGKKVEFKIATWPFVDRVAGLWDLRVNHSFSPATYGGEIRYYSDDLGEPTNAIGIAAVAGHLYVSMYEDNQLLVLDSASGQQVDTIPIAHPAGLHAAAGGKLLGVSDGKVVSIDPVTKAIGIVADHDLSAPHDVTTDSVGNVYVSDWGASFQVKVFSPAGKFLHAIGVHGGRPWVGAWNANGMLLPRGIAVTINGKLWVAEDDAQPNRVSVWNAATGELVRDYVGPAPYGGGGNFWVDPHDATLVLACGTFFHVDYARKTWTPISTPFRRMSLSEPFTPGGMGGTPGATMVIHIGVEYIYVTDGSYRMVVFRRDGLRLRPVAATGCLSRFITDDGSGQKYWDSDINYHMVRNIAPAFFKGHIGDNFVWIDKNGDGQVQADEMQWVHTVKRFDKSHDGLMPETCDAWGYGAGPDGALYLPGFCADRSIVTKIPVQSWLPNGVPNYDLASAKPFITFPTNDSVQGLFVDSSNHLIVSWPYEWAHPKNAIDCYDRSGKLLWSFAAPKGRQQVDEVQAENTLFDFAEPGNEHILATWLWHANFKPYLFTSDGLYVSSLLDDTRLGPTATWDESYKNYIQAPDSTAYIVDGVNDTYHIDKIVGLDKIKRFAGQITVTDNDLKAAASAAQAPVVVPQTKPVIHVSWLSPAPTIDGSLSDWHIGSALTFSGTKGRSARVELGRDNTNLYLAYDVHGATLVNKGANWQTLFISGDCVDLMLHVGLYKPHFAPAEGDERLLLSVYQGKPIAVLYRPVVPGTASPNRLLAASIDRIVRLDSAKVAVSRSGDSYSIEAAVPLDALGIDPASSDTLKGDVGVVFADETGANRALRLYYYNHDTDITADLTTEATLQPGNWGDIELPIGENLVKNGDFEEALASSADRGWHSSGGKNGMNVSITDTGAYTGSHALCFSQTTPVVFTPESYSLPDYGAFIKSADGGAGGGYGDVVQSIPITGGKKYALRMHLRTEDFSDGERKDVGPGRGYVSFQIWIDWGGVGGHLWGLNHQVTTSAWTTLLDPRFNYYGVVAPYDAPLGATSASIRLALVDNYAQKLPKAWVDDVEFAQVR